VSAREARSPAATAAPAAESGRIARRFAALRAGRRGGLVAFVTAGDPDQDTARALLAGLPAAGADLIELGMPFTDPMADGPAIQASSLRALKAGASLRRTLALVRGFRAGDADTPIVLMGYYNPIYRYGVDAFLADAKAAGVDGLIVVDLPPEEDDELCLPALAAGVNFIRLATPTTDDRRLPTVLRNTSGFVYYVSIAGITGTRSAADADIRLAVARLKQPIRDRFDTTRLTDLIGRKDFSLMPGMPRLSSDLAGTRGAGCGRFGDVAGRGPFSRPKA